MNRAVKIDSRGFFLPFSFESESELKGSGIMLAIDKFVTTEQHRIRVACAYLFSPQHAKDDGFVKHLNHNSLKGAFRKKAKMGLNMA